MIETIISLSILFHASSIGLGVGSSTLAIVSFLFALKDGVIDPSERGMLGVIYYLLRVAMVLILILTGVLAFLAPTVFGDQLIHLWILIAVLYINAVLMTLHLTTKKLGPAVQAGTWYTLGFVANIRAFDLLDLDLVFFGILYAIDILIAYTAVHFLISFREKQLKSR